MPSFCAWAFGHRKGTKALHLGSFRPGGATYLLQQTEDSELTRRRGRWASHKVMEIYLQEVASITLFPQLPQPVREHVLSLAQALPAEESSAHPHQGSAMGCPRHPVFSLVLFTSCRRLALAEKSWKRGKIFLVQHAAPDDSDVKCRRGPSDSYDAGPRVSMSRQWTFSCGGAKDE